MKPSPFIDRVRDSYDHYRTKLAFNPVYALYRALYFEIRGREPKKFRSKLGS